MDAKEYLLNIKKLDNLINSLIAEYESMQEMATKITGSCDGERVNASGSKEKMADIVAKMVDYQTKINENIDKFVNAKSNVLQVLHMLDNPSHISVLYKRYFEYKKWDVIADEMHIGLRGIHKIHGKALNEMDKILE